MEALRGKYLYEEREGGPDVDGNGLPVKARKRVRLTPNKLKFSGIQRWLKVLRPSRTV